MAADKNLANNSFESSRSVLQPVLRCANSRAGLGIGSDGAHYSSVQFLLCLWPPLRVPRVVLGLVLEEKNLFKTFRKAR